jgi:EmrB/QacA subfamily drug resistance transporter
VPAMSASDPSTPQSEASLSPELVRVAIVASFGAFLLNLSSTSISVALPKLMADLHAPLSTMQWSITGYLLTLTLVLPSFRWALERFGSRRLYVGCLVAFAATSLLCALAWSARSLIAFRVVQGAVGGLLAPLAQTLVAQLAGPKRMGRLLSIVAIPVLVAPVLGPVLGGLLIERLSWRWLFLVNLPLGLAGAWIAYRRLPPGTTETQTKLDRVGLALLSPGMALATYGVASLARSASPFTPGIVVPLVVGGSLIVAFVLYARRKPETALIDLRLFRHRTVKAALVAYLLTSFGTFGAQLLLPLYYQQARGQSPIAAGLLLAPQGLGMLLTLPQVGKLADRIDCGKIVMTGVGLTLLGTYAFTRATDHSSYVVLTLSLVIRGAGLGAITSPALVAAYRVLRPDEMPNATTAMNLVQRLGAPLGTAVMAVTLQRFIASGDVLARAFAHAFAVSAGLSALTFFAAFGLINQPREPRTDP